MQKSEEPTCLKAAWELVQVFYADKLSQAWLPERLVDWLAVNIFVLFHFACFGDGNHFITFFVLMVIYGRIMIASSQARR